jgi:hypothetical protein
MAKRSEFQYRYKKDSSLLHVIQNGYAAYPASYPVGTQSSTDEAARG